MVLTGTPQPENLAGSHTHRLAVLVRDAVRDAIERVSQAGCGTFQMALPVTATAVTRESIALANVTAQICIIMQAISAWSAGKLVPLRTACQHSRKEMRALSPEQQGLHL